MTPEYVSKHVIGHTFRVVEPASIGLPKHTTGEFDDLEPPMLRYWGGIRPGDGVIDIGAQFGVYTLTALAAGAHVIAVEPSDDGERILRENVKANHWQHACDIEKVMLFDGSPYPEELQRQVFGQHYPLATPDKPKRLDDLLASIDPNRPIDWIKMDPEGAELGIIMGGMETIKRWRPFLIIEDHDSVSHDPNDAVSAYPKSIDSSRRIHELLAGLDYVVDVMRWDVSRKFICAWGRA
jgi:FkbM family methyltransferase